MEQRINDIINDNNQLSFYKGDSSSPQWATLGKEQSVLQLLKIKENTKIILSVLQISVTITNTEIYYWCRIKVI